jgi:hypothetical protein
MGIRKRGKGYRKGRRGREKRRKILAKMCRHWVGESINIVTGEIHGLIIIIY